MKKSNFSIKKEKKEYTTLAQPFQRRLYRTALILTKNHNLAIDVVKATNQNAEEQYAFLNTENNFDFKVWLFQLLMNNFILHKKIQVTLC